MTIATQNFGDKLELATKLANDIAQKLSQGIETHGHASLAVSGGSTPKQLFKTLSQIDIAWNNVTIFLVDERFTAPDSDRSNEKLVRDNLLQNHAAQAKMFGFWAEGQSIDQAVVLGCEHVDALPDPLDVVVLGMGTDGHTASFFPGGSHLQAALDPQCNQSVIQMEAEGAGEPRLTLTLPKIINSKFLVLHIEGEAKHTVLDGALKDEGDDKLPIRVVVDHAKQPVNLYYAP